MQNYAVELRGSKLRESSFNREQFDYDTNLCFSMIKCLRARRGNVHRKQNCFRGVLLFKTHFAEFCVKSVCKTEPWNWAVRQYLIL